MYEKKFKAVPPQAFTSNGTNTGSLTIADSSLFKVKMLVRLKASFLPDLDLEIKRIESNGTIFVGDVGKNIDHRVDISAYTIAAGSNISWPDDQKRPTIIADEHERAVYEEEPVVAKRVILVDKLGNKIDEDNPFPIKSGTDWDEADITRDLDDDIVRVEFSKLGNLVETIDLEYNGEKSVVKVKKS